MKLLEGSQGLTQSPICPEYVMISKRMGTFSQGIKLTRELRIYILRDINETILSNTFLKSHTFHDNKFLS